MLDALLQAIRWGLDEISEIRLWLPDDEEAEDFFPEGLEGLARNHAECCLREKASQYPATASLPISREQILVLVDRVGDKWLYSYLEHDSEHD